MQTIPSISLKVPVPPRYIFSPGGDEKFDPEESSPRPGRLPARADDLPYRVEVWSENLESVEQTLAMTANGSIGYAAYYEATREYPDRYVVLRHKSRIVARWNPPEK